MDRYARKIGKKIKKTGQKEIPKKQKASGQICVWDFAKDGMETIKEEKIGCLYGILDSITESVDSTTLDNDGSQNS